MFPFSHLLVMNILPPPPSVPRVHDLPHISTGSSNATQSGRVKVKVRPVSPEGRDTTNHRAPKSSIWPATGKSEWQKIRNDPLIGGKYPKIRNEGMWVDRSPAGCAVSLGSNWPTGNPVGQSEELLGLFGSFVAAPVFVRRTNSSCKIIQRITIVMATHLLEHLSRVS